MSEPITLRDLAGMSVERLKGVGPKKLASLEKVQIENLFDLVTTYPRRWVDRTNEARIADLVPGEEALVLVTVRSVNKRMTRNRRAMVNVNVGDGSGRMDVVFFNQPWRERQLKEGLQIALFGKADTYRGGLQMSNPVVDLIGDRTGRIVPIYPQSEKAQINTWEMAGWVEETLRRCAARGIADPVPSAVRSEHRLIPRSEALEGIHLPEDMKQKERARRRLAFDELLRVQLVLVLRKRALERGQHGVTHTPEGELVERFYDSLPYPLTGAQRRTIDEIFADLANPHPMHRLLQGDVGAGKTVVSVAAMLVAVQSGHQAALMAPTEVLAEQHATSVREMLDGVTVPDPDNLFGDRPLRIELLTNRVTGAARKDVLAGLADGSVDIAIGTHALIQDAVGFESLGMVVVDEQHRFGVEQRSALRDKSAGGRMPDTLVMTATPIPRTAAMTVYGDLDVSVLDELPPGRTPIVTMWANGTLMETGVWRDVRSEVEAGRQAYVVCPLIGESDKLEVASAEETFERLANDELEGLSLGLLHGKLTPDEKEATMDRFRSGEIDVLVATTVIEVGVDVPNATVMVILDADRFGIAQLHQLRGRVGRGEHASTCWLVTQQTDPEVDASNPRVEALVETTDGFALAEVDLALRGEGTLMSSAQKGRSDLKLASLRRDRNLVELAREAAFSIVDSDPDLAQHPLLADELDMIFSDQDEEFLSRS
ncbi:ATP-dependent DNA helicase RecG [Ilumatobacter nonamiensis]|uniref:ATP-dependent DNA helicase RecG n=1 Tax=Ilumatobacter nonamiensis TaxID=467093 RepID=UPI0006862244|nr:ATP-dependent DNA helicase RecG [Ilumatobacter nonamiensis]